MSFTLTELLSAPSVVRETIDMNRDVIKSIAHSAKTRGITNITTVARGASDTAITYFKYMVEVVGGFMVSKFSPSIATIYGASVNLSKNMVLAVSQSGMSEDTIIVAESAKKSGALTIAVTNNPDSTLAKLCDYHIYLKAGEQRSVVSTKTYVSQLTVMYMLANALSSNPAKMNISTIPIALETFINENSDKLASFAKQNANINNFIVLSRGMMQGVAAKFSHMMMEVACKFSRPYSTTDFMHGPIAIVEEDTNIVIVAPDSVFSEEFINMTTRLSLLGANIIAITDIKQISDIASSALIMPKTRELEAPFIYAMALELIATHVSEELGFNPDSPRNLKMVANTK
ncbi:MAG: SIS domain-containing protein [Bacillota bacterium]